MTLLTKSKYIIGLSCSRYLWMMFHEPDKIPEFDLATKYIIQQGNIIGQLAKKLFPDGIDLPEESKDFKLNIQKTQEFLKQRKTIFEAGIVSEDLYARADILVPVGRDEWDIIEVKGSTKVKDEHFYDVSFVAAFFKVVEPPIVMHSWYWSHFRHTSYSSRQELTIGRAPLSSTL